MVDIDQTKHVGIIFQPRSGSHVLQHYLATVAEMYNSGEIFNLTMNLKLNVPSDGRDPYMGPTDLIDPAALYLSLRGASLAAEIAARRKAITALGATGRRTVFKLWPGAWMKPYPEVSEELAGSPEYQFIILQRADVLYSLISFAVSSMGGTVATTASLSDFHNKTTIARPKIMTATYLALDWLKYKLSAYIEEQAHIARYFKDAPTIYYEEFQDSPAKLRKMFTGVPSEIVSIPYSKFLGNHKDIITNLAEVEDLYEQFVNEHKEYFPQYFGKLPHIQIPACQGRQPRDLSKIQLAE